MAKVGNNIILFDVRGMLGKQVVFRKVNGKIIMAACPDFSHTIWSEKQVAHRQRFKEASAKAKAIASDPEQRAIYETTRKSGQTVYNVVLKELMRYEK